VLIAGNSGLGKSSFINTFLSVKFNRFVPEFVGDQNLKSTHSIKHNTVTKTEGDIKLELDMVDTPGYGKYASIENWLDMILEFVLSQALIYKQDKKSFPKAQVRDSRVHLCLFFIEGSQCNTKDLFVMYNLQKYVCIIPILAKADTFTTAELLQAKDNILRQALQTKIEFFNCEECLKEHCTKLYKTPLAPSPPFSVISDVTLIEDKDEIFYGRRCSRGVCDINDLEFSDFLLLKNYLLGYFLVPAVEETKVKARRMLKKYKKKLEHQKRSSNSKKKQARKKSFAKLMFGVVEKIVTGYFVR